MSACKWYPAIACQDANPKAHLPEFARKLFPTEEPQAMKFEVAPIEISDLAEASDATGQQVALSILLYGHQHCPILPFPVVSLRTRCGHATRCRGEGSGCSRLVAVSDQFLEVSL
jgi:hypothetical protein